MSIQDDIFEASIEMAVQERLKKELDKIADNPDAVIAAYQNKLQRAHEKIDYMQPLADFGGAVMQSDGWKSMDEVAKVLAIKGMGRNNMFELLRERGVLRYNKDPYQQYVDRGYFRLVAVPYEMGNTGKKMVRNKTVVSQRGIDFIRRIINEE